MRNRIKSGERLGYYYKLVYNTILSHQNPVTGLLPASPQNHHAWVRDNLYSILSVWGVSMAYKKTADLDEDRAKTYELEQSCVKLMRGLLTSMMQQKDKVEIFKTTQNRVNALHAKYSSVTGLAVVGDSEWGHLQIDATSLFLLVLAQMTASGLQIVFNLDEVVFIQNLVFYIESAYCVPDYGIWERGDKTNHGLPELNASSIGLAKAALEAMNELDLFGARGGPASVIHVLADEAQKCQAVLQSLLPRESNSKEVDSSLLSVISFPAFAVDDPDLIQLTRETIIDKLRGNYGCKRFLRDGHKTAREDVHRLYYEPRELKFFENIECEWPLFFCYLILDYCFQNDAGGVNEYAHALDKVLVTKDDMKFVPELYSVPSSKVELEYKNPGSQEREAKGRIPLMWAQSLYILGSLLQDDLLACGELDPLNRRLGSEKKPDVVVQVVVLAEDSVIQSKLAALDIHVQTVSQVENIEVQPARVLSKLYAYLGRSQKLGLSGRKSKDVGILSTSKLYRLRDQTFAFTPQFVDRQRFFIASDLDLLIDIFKTELYFLQSNWKHMLGRPIVTLEINSSFLEDDKVPAAMIATLKKLKSGYINGTRVALGKMNDFLNTSCITSLNFLNDIDSGYPDKLREEVDIYLQKQVRGSGDWKRTDLVRMARSFNRQSGAKGQGKRKTSVAVIGSIRKTRSFFGDEVDPTLSRRESMALTGAPSIPEFGFPLDVSAASQPGLAFQDSIRSPSPDKDDLIESFVSHRVASDANYENIDLEDLLLQLKEAETLEEQGDILHYLVGKYGINHETGSVISGQPVTVKDILKDFYERVCHAKNWALVRHTAGMLGKRVEDLAKAVTDLLVRQKQVTVGLLGDGEITITAPLPANELCEKIHEAYGSDESAAMLTQELLIYLSMFVRTEQQLFAEMIRLRVGLIIQVMAAELSRTLGCDIEAATESLLNLSPFTMKNLLYHIVSGKEFNIDSARSGTFFISSKSAKVSKKTNMTNILGGSTKIRDAHGSDSDRQGQWLRRRKIDGALNRVPKQFYQKIWKTLTKCKGVNIESKVIPNALTEEMTAGELKFALEVESVLNTVPQPEYRQLVVEAMTVISLIAEEDQIQWIGDIVCAQDIVQMANNIFLQEQKESDGDSLECCACDPKKYSPKGGLLCGGAAYICNHFYDSGPSGAYGTMTYMIRAAASILSCFPADNHPDCTVS